MSHSNVTLSLISDQTLWKFIVSKQLLDAQVPWCLCIGPVFSQICATAVWQQGGLLKNGYPSSPAWRIAFLGFGDLTFPPCSIFFQWHVGCTSAWNCEMANDIFPCIMAPLKMVLTAAAALWWRLQSVCVCVCMCAVGRACLRTLVPHFSFPVT